MIDGMTILNKTMIMEKYIPNQTLFKVLGVIFLLSFIISLASLNSDSGIAVIIAVVCLVSFIGLIILECRSEEVPTDRYRYEVTIDDSVQFTDIYEKYDVVERRGEIWVLEDKE